MKRFAVSIDDIASWNLVSAAAHRAAKGKRKRSEVERFLGNAEESIAYVVTALRNGMMPVGRFHRFVIYDPKRREITAAPFADRVAHHAIVAPILQPLESWLAHTSFACRQGKGVHAAALYTQRQCRRFPVWLKMDVRGYFDHIDHLRLIALLKRKLRGDHLFTLINAVLKSHEHTAGFGLPIGALTSQQFANVYLNLADQWLQNHPQVLAHCRYMDDVLIWCNHPAEARSIYKEFSVYLKHQWSLELKPPIIQKSRFTLPFCGYRITPSMIKPGRRRLRRCEQRLRYWQNEFREGRISMCKLRQTTDAILATLQPGQSLHWRKRLIARGLDGSTLEDITVVDHTAAYGYAR